MWRKRNAPPLLLGFHAGTTTLEISLVVPQKTGYCTENPAIPFLGIYPKDAPTYNKDTCSTMFITALFIIARSWKEPRCSPTEKWILKNVVHLHNEVLLSYKKQWIYEILRQVDGSGGYHPEWGNSITKEHTCYALTDKWILAQKLRILKIQLTDNFKGGTK